MGLRGGAEGEGEAEGAAATGVAHGLALQRRHLPLLHGWCAWLHAMHAERPAGLVEAGAMAAPPPVTALACGGG